MAEALKILGLVMVAGLGLGLVMFTVAMLALAVHVTWKDWKDRML